MSKMIRYKTGDTCPCCGQPIKLTHPADLYAFSLVCHLLGLNEIARNEESLQRAAARRRRQ